MGLKASKKEMISIETFLENYMGICYTERGKLTHYKMQEFLARKWYRKPCRVRFKEIKREDILKGRVLLVKDEVGSVFAYRNPQAHVQSLLETIHLSNNEAYLKQVHEQYLEHEKNVLLKKKRRGKHEKYQGR